MAEKTDFVSFRVTPEEKAAFEKLAAADDRSLSSYVLALLRQRAREQGLLSDPTSTSS